jgi:uncharacterized protein
MRFLLWMVVALWPTGVAAQGIGLPDPLSDTVSDFADVIPADAEDQIATELRRHRAETGVQMVVVTMVAKQGARPDERLESYAKRLFNAWGVGDKARNNGVMILLVTGDRAVRIATGSAYDRVYDGFAQRVIDTVMVPAFRDGRLADGLQAGVAQSRRQIIDRFVAAGRPTKGATPSSNVDVAPILVGSLVIFGVPGLAGWAFWRQRKRCPACGKPGISRQHETIRSATKESSGEGKEIRNCRYCNHREISVYAIEHESHDRSRFRSGSGFGGGRSSGGGATGRW